MTYFGELVINGVSLGFIYTLIALGFVVIYKATEVINFAQGSMLLLGAYLVAQLHDRLGFVGALLVGIAAGAVGAFLIQYFLVRGRGRVDPTALTIITIGVDIVLASELNRRIGQQVLSFGAPWGDQNANLGPFVVPQARVAAVAISVVLVIVFFLAFKFTSWGIATRATAEDGEAAALMGIRAGRVASVAWIVAGGLATLAGVFLGLSPSPGLTNTSNLTALNAFPAVVVGGLDSTGGAVAGGVLIGVVQSLVDGYNSQLSFLGQPLSEVSAYVVMLLVLLWRPSGLFGTREVARV
ncbi:branched-chain amino acid ABC transporter permease [Amycolatopsis benzoatilytica]|uniref:branched-chain amino acid ABC transporter permease n=1 Tax=Amycolatopsis benzoatilytica TaxID=346045 RepID=UPI00036099D0|nr:branched-chain amino acid ABC transporter permease [Amycolatopsis benzoatilytica]